MRSTKFAALVLAAVLAAPAALHAQDFSWRGRLANGRQLEIRGVNGDVRATPAEGDEIVVTARKTARRSDTESVRIEVIEHAGGVTICAVYPTPRDARRENECRPGGGGSMSVQNNDVQVDFTVRVPAHVDLAANTVNGDVRIEQVGGDVDARTVNGSINLATRGYASASTVNGSIHATLGTSRWNDDLEFRTVNGGITVEVPGDLNADVSIRTVNGEIDSDFPMTLRGRISPRRLDGQIGNGGHEIRAQTVNGSVRLRRIG